MARIKVPWGAWHGDRRQILTLPDRWRIDYIEPRHGRELTRQKIAHALDAPVASDPLTMLATRVQSVCIVTDDLARPTPTASILTSIAERLKEGGIADRSVKIIVATGAHRALTPNELEMKLGSQALSRFSVESHSSARLAPTGVRYGDADLFVNASYLAAELKILIGSPLPHAFAGSSGGAKLVIPGLASLDATLRSHKFVLMGLRRGGDVTKSTFREHIEGLVSKLGMHFNISVVTDANRKIVGLFAGDLVESHRAASSSAVTLYHTPVRGEYDCLILNAYPKDIDLIQSENAFVALKRTAVPVVSDGLVVLTTAASEGLGSHGLFEPGALAYRQPVRPRAVRGRELWIYAPKIPSHVAHRLFPTDCRIFQASEGLATALQDRFPGLARCCVLPAAPMQLISTSAELR